MIVISKNGILVFVVMFQYLLIYCTSVTSSKSRNSHLHHQELQSARISTRVVKNEKLSKTKTINNVNNKKHILSHISSVTKQQDSLCPVSSIVNIMNKTNHYFYPLDIFQSSELSQNELNNNTQSCLEIDYCYTNHTSKGFCSIPHICPIKSTLFCPVTMGNILHGIGASEEQPPVDTTTSKSNSICSLQRAISSARKARNKVKSPINVFVFGMSGTAGVNGAGCLSFPSVDWDENTIDWLERSKSCAWPHYIGIWLQSIVGNKVKVNVYNLARSGATSLLTAQKFSSIFKSGNSAAPTSRDIVLLDFSTTDGAFIYSSDDLTSIETAMHVFMKQLHAHYLTPQETPVVVILETEMNYRTLSKNVKQQYANVAAHYGYYFWSIRDAVFSGYNASQQDNSSVHYLPYINHLKKERGAERQDTHPPWFMHFYMGDLIAALFKHEMKLCNNVSSALNTNGVYKKPRNHTVANSRLVANGSSGNDMLMCNESITPLLSISYDAVIRNQTIIGSYSLGDYWKVTTDLRGRGGFIRSLDDTDRFPTHDNATITFHFSSFSAADEGSSVVSGGHFFRQLGASAGTETQTTEADGGSKYMLSLFYLSSYVHVGVVDVYICNQFFGTIDALWTDKKVSLPTIKNIVFDYNLLCATSDIHTVEIRHKIQLHNDNNHYAHQNNSRDISNVGGVKASSDGQALFNIHDAPRYKQMFKITSIDVCQY